MNSSSLFRATKVNEVKEAEVEHNPATGLVRQRVEVLEEHSRRTLYPEMSSGHSGVGWQSSFKPECAQSL